MNFPMISVVMPVYNAEPYLDEAIQSILSQTFKDFEFIIINDGSNDKSLTIMQRYAENDSRIKIISRENKGLIASLNEGFSLAKGTYVARMDADDASSIDRFMEQIKLMTEYDLDICGCHYQIINKDGKFIDCIYTPLNNDSLLLYLAISVPFAHGSVLIKKEFMTNNNLQYGQSSNVFAEDKALWQLMYMHNAKFGNVNKILFAYREFNSSLSKRKIKGIHMDDQNLKKKFILHHTALLDISIKKMSLDMNNLSNRELEYLGELMLIFLIKFRKIEYFRNFMKLNKRFKALAFLKYLSNFFKY